MKDFYYSLKTMLGAAPHRYGRDEFTAGATELHKSHKANAKERVAAIHAELAVAKASYKWRKYRWPSIIIINLLFVVSFHFDVQLVEGALTASRFVGFHMADLNSALQVMLAYKHIVLNLVIGTVTVFILWWLVGGRAFCSWCCPYHLVSEWAEMLHLKLVAKRIIKDHPLHRGTRTVLYVVFVVATLVTGYTVFETISPVGILSRALIYGASLGLIFVAVLLLIEIFYIRRFWCRYMCPMGVTYAFVGAISPLTIHYDLNHCLHEGECRAVCLVPHVLDMTVKNRSHKEVLDIGADCTRCGMCLEACPTGALSFRIKGMGGLL